MKKALIPAAIVAALAFASGVHADGPSAAGSVAGCDAFTINVSGLQAGDQIIAEQGSSAPGMMPVDEATGTVHVTLKVTTDPWFTADVVLERGEQLTVLYHQLVDCDGNAPAVDPTVVVSTVAVAEPVAPASFVARERRVSERLVLFGLR